MGSKKLGGLEVDLARVSSQLSRFKTIVRGIEG